jgi:hypothetical protein
MLWDRLHDTFAIGQWLNGRIYERRGDLSPDGRYLIYFARREVWGAGAGSSWTAISRAPFLKALAFFPKGDCWHGGGLFLDDRRYWLNDGCGHEVERDTRDLRRDVKYQPAVNYGGECRGVYYPRLLRDGWTLVERIDREKWHDVDVFEKPLPRGWILRKRAHGQVDPPPGKGCYWDEHELAHHESGRAIAGPDWEWADRDGDRLAWAAGGKLFVAEVSDDGLAQVQELYDFNPMTFEPIQAPY